MKHEDRLGAENGGSGRPENSYCQRLVPCYMEMMLLFTLKCRESRVSAQLRKVGTILRLERCQCAPQVFGAKCEWGGRLIESRP